MSVFPLILIVAFFFVILAPYYQNQAMVLGGEGSYYTDFVQLAKNYGYTWYESGAGMFALSLNYIFHLSFLQMIIPDERIINFITIFSIYFLPFISCFALCRIFQLNLFVSLLISGFYLFNPFVANFLKSINQWNMLAVFILPANFYILFKLFDKEKYLFFFIGLFSLFFSFTNANPPTMIIYHIGIALSIFLIGLFKKQIFSWGRYFKKLLIVELSFILFNFWWLINTLYIFFDAQKGYSRGLAISWLRDGQDLTPVLWRGLTFTGLLPYPSRPDYDFFAGHISSVPGQIILIFPVIMVVCYFFWRKKQLYPYWLALFCLISVFLAKGTKGVFGSLYELMVMKLPLFQMFKSAPEKWGILFIFLMTLLIIYIALDSRKTKYYRYFIFGLIIYVAYNSVPFITGNFIPDYKYNERITGSRNFYYKQEYYDLRAKINSDQKQYRVLSLPGSNNYQVALRIDDKRFYTGNDPILSNTSKAFLSPYNGTFITRFPHLFEQIDQSEYLKLLNIYNIGKIVINKDTYPWFGFTEKQPYPIIEKILDNQLPSQKNDVYDLYDLTDHFLPRFYIPDQIFYAPDSKSTDMFDLISSQVSSSTSAFFIADENQQGGGEAANEALIKTGPSSLILRGKTQTVYNEEKLKQQVAGLDKSGVYFAYARWKPGSLIYPYVEKKENKLLSGIDKNSLDYFQTSVLLAGKRITEIQFWDKGFEDIQFDEVLNRYEYLMSEGFSCLDSLSVENEKLFEYFARSEVTFLAYSERLKNIVIGNWGETHQRTQKVEATEKKLKDQLRSIYLRHYNFTRYYYTLPEESNYHLFVQSPDGLEGWTIVNYKAKEGEFLQKKILPKTSQWQDLGEFYLKEGNHWFSFLAPQRENLLSTAWSKVVGSDNPEDDEGKDVEENILFQEVAVKPSADYEMEMDFNSSESEIFLKISAVGGIKDIADFYQTPFDKSRGILYDSIFSVTNEGEYKASFAVPYGVDKIRVEIIFENEQEAQAALSSSSIALYKLVVPKLMITKPVNYFYNQPQINFQKINPTKYYVRLRKQHEPFLLVFSEAFHPGWKIYLATKDRIDVPVLETYFGDKILEHFPDSGFFDSRFFETWGLKLAGENHLKVNGYANSWWITPEIFGDRQEIVLIVEYSGQKYFYWASMITILTIIISLSLFLSYYAKKNHGVSQ